MKPGLNSMLIGRWLKLRKKFIRLREWALVGALAGRRISLRQLWRYARAPKVPRAVWVARLRRCRGCLLYDASLRRCHRDNPYGSAPLGCGCWVPAVAKMPSPYEKVHVLHENQVLKNTPLDKTYTETHRGCWGYATMRGEIGWGEMTMKDHQDEAWRRSMELFEARRFCPISECESAAGCGYAGFCLKRKEVPDERHLP